MGEKPSVFCRTMSPWKLRSMVLPTDSEMPAAKTVTNTTTARPIISEAAVVAVRPGLRTVFSRASRPVRPRTRSSGQPATEASGLTSRGLNSETPNRVAAAPPPTSRAAVLDSAPPKRPSAVRASPPTPSTTATAVTIRPRRRLSGSSASRSAAIGDTRVARSAGLSAENSVTRIPTSSATTIVRAAITVPVLGRSMPKRLEHRVEGLGEADPADHAEHRAHHADHRGLGHDRAEHLAARGSQRAQQPQLARALCHRDVEDVEDQERADEQRDPAEHQQHDLEEGQVLGDVVGLALGRLLTGLHLHLGREHAVDAPLELLG